jgi:hypothetical protein
VRPVANIPALTIKWLPANAEIKELRVLSQEFCSS